MADTPIPPYRCTYCLQALPEEHDQELFGTSFYRPRADDPESFVADAETILRYAAAVGLASHGAERISDDVVTQLRDLVDELIEEALRRLARASDAFHIVMMRKADTQPAPAS